MRIPLPDLLATRWGRLFTFFMLYVTEGIPLGFTATAIATQMRRQGLSPIAIGAFVGSLYLPWAFKWIAGPSSTRSRPNASAGSARGFFAMQLGMMATLLIAVPINYRARSGCSRRSSCSTTRSARRRTSRSTRSRQRPPGGRARHRERLHVRRRVDRAARGRSLVLFLASVVPFRTPTSS
jgi:hypothetical protein